MKSKLLLLTLVSTLLAGGCANKQETCATSQAALAAYLAVINAGGEPSRDEIAIAAGATAFLTAYCGWTAPIPPQDVRGQDTPLVDRYGVPIVVPRPIGRAARTGSSQPQVVKSYGDWTAEEASEVEKRGQAPE